MENVVLATFTEESLAYQAYSEIKNDAANNTCFVSQIALMKMQDGNLTVKESYDDGSQTADDTWNGGLVGMLAGVIAGPVGMLLGASIGMLIGSAVDFSDASKNASYLENAAKKLSDGTTALVMLAAETDDALLDSKLSPFHATVTRYEAAVLQEEVEEAIRMQDDLAREACENLRKERSDARKARITELREKAKARLKL